MACRLLLLDDHPALTQGLAALLGEEPDMVVVGQFAHGQDLLDFLAAPAAPVADLLLLDLYLAPPHDGLTLLPRLRRGWPALRVLVYSSTSSALLSSQVSAAGAHGFVDKSAEASVLLAAIRAVHAGQLAFQGRVRHVRLASSPEEALPTLSPDSLPGAVTTDALLRLRRLSAREREIIALVCAGYSTRAIAEQLGLTRFTVSTHRRNILDKLNLRGAVDLIRFAHEHGLKQDG